MTCCLSAGWIRAETRLAAAVMDGSMTPGVLTLAQARQIAFERNWDLLASKSDVDIATAQKIIAREFPNPTLSWSTAKVPADHNPASTRAGNDVWGRNYDTIFAINQLFEIGGKRSNRRAAAAAGLKAAEARLMDARRTLDLAVTQAYLNALLAQTNVNILRRSAESLRKEAKIAEARLNAGDISRADKSQIEIAAERLEMDAAAAETKARTSRIAVEILLGVTKPSGSWVPGDSLDSLATQPPLAAAEGTSGSLPFPMQRPDLMTVEANRQRAEADLKYQKALRIPDPSLLVQYEHEPPDQPNTIGFGLSFPLPLWNRNRGGIQAAQAARNQAEVQVQKTIATISAEISTAQTAYADAMARWQHSRDAILPKSEEVRKTVSFAYEKGGASLLDLLSAERNDNELRLATAQAAAEAANAAAALKAAWNITDISTNQTNHPK
jgi:cobalt-zinc-cadmium efflux system outer membrane protein